MPGTAHSPGPPVAAAGGVQQRGGIKGKRRQGKIRRTGCTQGHSAVCCRDDEIPRPRAPCARVACGRHSLHAFGGCGVLECLQVWLRGHVALTDCMQQAKQKPTCIRNDPPCRGLLLRWYRRLLGGVLGQPLRAGRVRGPQGWAGGRSNAFGNEQRKPAAQTGSAGLLDHLHSGGTHLRRADLARTVLKQR